MKKWAFLLFSLWGAIAVYAQNPLPTVSVFTAPSGTCSQAAVNQQVVSTGLQWSCQNVNTGTGLGTWTPFSTGAGSVPPATNTPVPGLVNDGTTANQTAINTALATGGAYSLPSVCQGGTNVIDLTNQILITNISGWSLAGPVFAYSVSPSDWTQNKCPTVLDFTSSTGADAGVNIVCNNSSFDGECTGGTLANLDIWAPNAPAGSVGIIVNSTGGANNAYIRLNQVLVSAPQCLTTVATADIMGTLYCIENPNGVGTYGIDLGTTNNSTQLTIQKGFGGSYNLSSAPPVDAGILRFQTGFGSQYIFGDTAFTNNVWTAGLWNGSAWTSNARGEVFSGDYETIFGYTGICGSNSSVTVHDQGNASENFWLGPKYFADTNCKMQLLNMVPANQTPPAWNTVTASGSGSSYTATQECFFREAVNPSATFAFSGSVTMAINSGPSVAQCITPAAGQNIVLTPNTADMAGVTTWTIYRGTTTTAANAVQIASGILPGAVYTSNGSESTGGAPAAGNIPLAFQALSATVTANCSQGNPSAVGAGSLVLDSQGAAFNPCDNATSQPVSFGPPTATAETVGNFYRGVGRTTSSENSNIWVGTQSTTGCPGSCVTTYGMQSLVSPNLFPASESLNDSTSAMPQLGITQAGTGGSTFSPLVEFSGGMGGDPNTGILWVTSTNTTPGTIILGLKDDANSVSSFNGFYTNQFQWNHDFKATTVGAATNGANISSSYYDYVPSVWDAIGGVARQPGVRHNLAVSNTANTPTYRLQWTSLSGFQITPSSLINDESFWTGGTQVAQLLAGVSGTLGPIVMGNATSGLLTLEPAPGAIASYTLQFPTAQPTGGNTYLSCTAASPAVCTWGAGGSGTTGLSGMTAGQVPIAATGTTVTSSEPVAGSGAGIVTGPVSGTTANHIVTENGTNGQVTDSGVLITAIPAADIASGALANGMTGTTQSQLDGSTKLATTLYTDTAVSNAVAGVNPAVAVLAASTATIAGTYAQVGGGVGDTFTVTATGAFTLDGIAINTIGQRVLLKNQSSANQNGIYTATVVGTTGISAVFTRALDYDTPSDVNNTGSIPVQSGTVNTTTSWLLTSQVTSIGSSGSSLTYAQFSLAPSTLVTSAASLASGAIMTGAGSQGSQTNTTGTGVVTALGVNTGSAGAMGVLLATGTAAMNTAAVASGACETVVTVAASGVATTDVIETGFNGDPTAVTGYGASATGAVLSIYPYPTSGNVNFKVCNSSSGSITPGALTLNWKVYR